MDFYKARVVYGEQGVEAVEYAPYFIRNINSAQWKFSGDKHKSLQVDTERTFHQRYPLVML